MLVAKCLNRTVTHKCVLVQIDFQTPSKLELHFSSLLYITMSNIWFDGPIAEAISLVAEKQCVFLVYIHGNITVNLPKETCI